jgi:hypothetical protein
MHARSFLVENLHPNSSSKDTLLPFVTILRAGPDPEALVRLQFPPSRTINSLFNRIQSKLQLFQTHPSPSCKDKQCDPLRLVIESSCSMTKEPSIFRKHGWGWMSQNRPFKYLWVPSNSQTLSGNTQFYLFSNITSTFIQQPNLGNHSRSQRPKTNCLS